MNNTYTTSDIGLASFLMLRGAKLISASLGRGSYEIVFDSPSGLCDSLAVEYINSEFLKYDTYSKNLRLLLKKRKTWIYKNVGCFYPIVI